MEAVFNGAALRLARTLNDFSLEDVADRLGKTRQYLHKLETTISDPNAELVSQLAFALSVRPEFFYELQAVSFSEDNVHFRKMFTARSAAKQTVIAKAELLRRLVALLERELSLPDVRIPEVPKPSTVDEIETAAETCRKEWGLGMGPISNVVRLAENIGAVVTTFTGTSREVDALSVGVERPLIIRNDAKESPCRLRFDVAHELGHAVLHPGKVTGDRVSEGEANRFASALLVPKTMMVKLFPKTRGIRQLDWRGISEFKLTWGVSKSALLYRARQLELISDQQYRSGVISLRRLGEAIKEREDDKLVPEQPELLNTCLNLLASAKGVTLAHIARRLNVQVALLAPFVHIRTAGGEPINNVVELRKFAA